MSTTRIQRSRSRHGPIGARRPQAPRIASIRRLRLRVARLARFQPVSLRGRVRWLRQASHGWEAAVDSFAVQPNGLGSLAAKAGSSFDLLMVDAAPHGFEPW